MMVETVALTRKSTGEFRVLNVFLLRELFMLSVCGVLVIIRSVNYHPLKRVAS